MLRVRSVRIGTVLIGATLISALLAFVALGYEQGWTGFGSYVGADGKTVPPKRLWDWLSLLIVPFFLAVAAWFLNDSRKAADAKTESDRRRQTLLDAYFEWITKLILDGHLDEGSGQQSARTLARTKTLAVLGVLDGDRKAQVLQFLYETQMLKAPPRVNLNGADFRDAVLDEARLVKAEIRGAYFCDASLKSANLRYADLSGCDFTNADFSNADLAGTNFRQAVFDGAKLVAARNIADANFEDVDLSSAITGPRTFRG